MDKLSFLILVKEGIFMGQRKNKLTKKERKALNFMNTNFIFNQADAIALDEFLDNDEDSILIGEGYPHEGPIHYTDFICSHCGIHEDIPTHIVMNFEFLDGEQQDYMPAFTCKKCGYDMFPVYFKGYTGKIYQYKSKAN